MSPQCRSRGIMIAAVAVVLFPAFSQTTSTTTTTGGTTSTGTNPSAPGLPTVSSTGTGTNTTSTPQPRVPQPIRVSGRVMLDDGTAPTSSVVIQRVCNGGVHSEGYTAGSRS